MNDLIKFYYVDIDVWWISSWNIWLYRFIYIFLKIFGFLYKWYVDFFYFICDKVLYVYCMNKYGMKIICIYVFIYMLFLFIF